MDTTTYVSLRSQIRTGWLLGVGGAGIISWLIKWWTHGPYSHVGLLVKLSEGGTERVFLLHSTGKTGVVLLPASRYLSDLKGTAWLVPLDAPYAALKNPNYEADLLGYALAQLGRGYNLSGAAKFVLPFLPERRDKLFCSELALAAVRAAKLLLAHPDTLWSPEVLIRQRPPFLEPIELA